MKTQKDIKLLRLASWHSRLSHCLKCWHVIRALMHCPAALLPSQHPAYALGKQYRALLVLGPGTHAGELEKL